MLFTNHTPSLPFKQWIFHDKQNRILLLIASSVIAIQFIWFKVLYPYPNFFPDSYEYIKSAFENRSIDYRPIGYAKFLRLFSSFTSSHFFLILFQYLVLQSSLLYFTFSLGYLLAPGKWLLRILVLCSILNPLALHVSNFVSSDPLFTAISLVWFTQLLWIIYQPTRKLFLLHGVVLLLAFIVRYNALYYPLISILIILFSQVHVKTKCTSIGFIVLSLGLFIGYTQYRYEKVTGSVQFSAFSGWQLVANALVAYTHAPLDEPSTVPEQFRQLHTVVNRYMDSLHRVPHESKIESATYYLWFEKSPLLQYMNTVWAKDNTTGEFNRWALMAPLYADYGRYLIKRHPELYLKYHIAANLVLYYTPPSEYLGVFNMEGETIDPVAVAWFGLKSNKIHTYYSDKKIVITDPIIFSLVNLVFLLAFAGFTLLGGFNKCNAQSKRILLCMILVWLCNIGFSVLASPVVLRYQVFPMAITFTFGLFLIAFMVQEYKLIKSQQVLNKSNEAIQPEIVM